MVVPDRVTCVSRRDAELARTPGDSRHEVEGRVGLEAPEGLDGAAFWQGRWRHPVCLEPMQDWSGRGVLPRGWGELCQASKCGNVSRSPSAGARDDTKIIIEVARGRCSSRNGVKKNRLRAVEPLAARVRGVPKEAEGVKQMGDLEAQPRRATSSPSTSRAV